jgi:hypothetical protein
MARAISSLPVPVSPRIQHGGIEWRHGIYLGQHKLKRRTFCDDLLEVQHGADFILQVKLFLFQLVREFADFAYARALSWAMAT